MARFTQLDGKSMKNYDLFPDDLDVDDILADLLDDEPESDYPTTYDEAQKFRDILNSPDVPPRFKLINYKSVSVSRRKPASINKVQLRRIHWASLVCGPAPVLLLWTEDARGTGYLIAARGLDDVQAAIKRFAALKDLNDALPEENMHEEALTLETGIEDFLDDPILCFGVMLRDAMETAFVLEDWIPAKQSPLPSRLEFAQVDESDASPNGAELLGAIRRDVLLDFRAMLDKHQDALPILSAEYPQVEFGRAVVYASTALEPLPGTTHPNRITEITYHAGGLVDGKPAGLYHIVMADSREVHVLARSEEEVRGLVAHALEEPESPEAFISLLLKGIEKDAAIQAAPEKADITKLIALLHQMVHSAWHALLLPEAFKDVIPGAREEQLFLAPGEAAYPAWQMTAQQVDKFCSAIRAQIAKELA